MAETKKITFQMNEKEYYAAQKFRNKKMSKVKINGYIVLAIILAALVVVGAVIKNVELLTLAVGLLIIMALFLFIRRKAEASNFEISPILNAPQLISYNEDIEFTNSFEKILCPKFKIYAAGQTEKYLFIIATPRKGCFCINKARYSSEELDGLINILKNTGKFKGEK